MPARAFLAVGLPPRLVVGELSGVDALLEGRSGGGQRIAVAGEATVLVPPLALGRLAGALSSGRFKARKSSPVNQRW